MIRRACVVVAACLALVAAPVPAYAAAPPVPDAVEAAAAAGRVRVGWSPSGDGAPFTGFAVYRKVAGGEPELLATAGADDRAYTDTAPPLGPLVSYGVAQVNADGAGPALFSAGSRVPNGEVVFRAKVTGEYVTHDLLAQAEGSPLRTPASRSARATRRATCLAGPPTAASRHRWTTGRWRRRRPGSGSVATATTRGRTPPPPRPAPRSRAPGSAPGGSTSWRRSARRAGRWLSTSAARRPAPSTSPPPRPGQAWCSRCRPSAIRSGTVTLRAVSGGRLVRVDGLATRRA